MDMRTFCEQQVWGIPKESPTSEQIELYKKIHDSIATLNNLLRNLRIASVELTPDLILTRNKK